MVLDTTETRLNRVENDIETLRTTQANILDHLDSYSKTLNETRNIADENRQRLDSIENRQKQMEDRQKQMEDRQKQMEDRQKQMEDRQKRMEDRQKRMEDRQNSLEEIGLEHSAALLEVHNILLSIANSLDLTLEMPGGED